MRSGVLAEFDAPEPLALAYERLRTAGYTRLRTYTPYPVREVLATLPESPIPWLMLGAALLGGGGGYALQWWCNARSYPLDVGGRPLDSVPAFIPITFESAVLAAALTGFFAMLWFCGLPRLSHPLFEVDGFERAFVDRFWLGVDDSDPAFDEGVADQLARLGAGRCERLRTPPSRGGIPSRSGR
jgi:hypothetical protein